MEGVVKRVNGRKGYGFIESGKKDYFIHRWDIEENLKLKEGDRVSFKVEKAPQDFRAINVKKISEKSKKKKGGDMKRMQRDQDMLIEYDFSKGVMGKYSKKYEEGKRAPQK